MHCAREDFKRRGRPAYEEFCKAYVATTSRQTGSVVYPACEWKLWGVGDALSEFIQYGRGNLPHFAEFERFNKKLETLKEFEVRTTSNEEDAMYGRTRTTVFYKGEAVVTNCDREGSLGS